jgi:hypothetical protein
MDINKEKATEIALGHMKYTPEIFDVSGLLPAGLCGSFPPEELWYIRSVAHYNLMCCMGPTRVIGISKKTGEIVLDELMEEVV